MQDAIRDTKYAKCKTQYEIREKFKHITYHISRITSPKGFTLIELLVAMGIIGLLATISLGNYINIKRKSRDAQRKHDLEQVQRALEMYYNDYGNYPEVADLPAPGSPWEDANGTLYIKTWPVDPKNYAYDYEGGGVSYKIFAFLENDQDPSRLQCVIDLNNSQCGAPNVCNYGVSSVNLGICD